MLFRSYADGPIQAEVRLPDGGLWRNLLTQEKAKPAETLSEEIAARPEVMECYLMTGDADYLLRVVAPDIDSFQRFLMDHLTRIRGVASIKSSFALKQVSYRTALPLTHIAG